MLWFLLFACGGGAPNEGGPAPLTLTLAGYTTPREAYAELLPRFAERWKAEHGQELRFETSWQASGAQSRAVAGGFEADVVALSLAPDVDRLVEAGLVAPTWASAPHGGMVTTSLVVVAVRPGNPRGIQDWPDLAAPGLEVLTPNVRTSGGAMWNVAGVVGAGLRGRAGVNAGDEAGAEALLAGVLRNVKVMDKGARESLVNFEKGVGDAAITYENEVLVARAAGRPMDYVVPPSTIVIENPVAVVDGYVDRRGTRAAAEALVAWLHTDEAQAVYARHGLRPVQASLIPSDWPRPEDAFRVADFGGWPALTQRLFADGALYDRALAQAQGR